MLEKGIVYIFKLIAITVISVLLWAFFMGKPTAADKNTTTQTYATQGSKFEEIIYGSSSGGFHGVSLDNYLRNTGNNGYNLWFYKTGAGVRCSAYTSFADRCLPTGYRSGDGGFTKV